MRFIHRTLLGVFAVLAFVVVGFSTADAGQWITKEIFWKKSSQGSPYSGTAVYIRDTTFNVIAAGQTDTTGGFSLNKASLWRENHPGAATTVDTVFPAYLVLQQDSLGVAASTISAITYKIDGRMGGFSGNAALSGWTTVDSTVAKFTSAAAGGSDGNLASVAIPIRTIAGLGTPDAENGFNQFYRLMAYEALRVRITSVTGLMSAARVFVRYWTESE